MRGVRSITSVLRRSLVAGGLLGVLLLGLSGCGRSTFVGRQYNDFTAYYNKFHNAQKAFEEGRRSIRENARPIDRDRYLPLFPVPEETAGESFEGAIQKSADVLREHPNSDWVDDALLLIGKSYYYQQNYVGATQKFREVIGLGTGRREEARFWLVRTLIAAERYDAAAQALQEGLNDEATADRWEGRLYLAQGALRVRREQWEAAAQSLQRGLAGTVPDRWAARGAFLLGQVRETIGDTEGARRAYRSVLEHGPRYELGFMARLNAIELRGRHGDPEAALARLSDLEGDDKNYEMRGEMALVRARILRADGRPGAAEQALKDILYGEEAPSGRSQGRLQYELATLYRDAYADFGRAAAHFDTARTTLGGRDGVTEADERRRWMPQAPTDAGTMAEQFESLATQAEEVARLDSLLRLGDMSDQELQEYVADLRSRRRARRAGRRASDDRESQRGFGSTRRGQAPRARQRQEAAPAADTRGSDAGFLFYKDPARVQEGRRQFRRVWGDRPRVDNWRRRTAIRAARSADDEAEAAADSAAARPEQDRFRTTEIDLSAVPRDSASQAEMRAQRAVARYELANALFLAAGRPDSAATWYRRIMRDNRGRDVALRAQYALAEVHRAQGDSAKARAAYREVIDRAPGSSLAMRARQRLGRPEPAPTESRAAEADSAYARVYRTWQAGRLDSALTGMLDVADRFPETRAAPRALLASGMIYWSQVQRDTSAAPRTQLADWLAARRPVDTTQADTSTTSSPSASTRIPAPPDTVRSGPPTADADTATGAGRLVSPDSTAPSDSTGPPQRASASDSTAVPTPLEGMLAYLRDRYPDTPQARRARSLLQVLREQRSSSAPAPDTSAGKSPARSSPRLPTSPPDTARAAGPANRPRPDTTREAKSTSPSPGEGLPTASADGRLLRRGEGTGQTVPTGGTRRFPPARTGSFV